jgi:hypothetical protein
MMNKKTLYTAAGIALAFIIAIGGWLLTSSLIDRKSDALLSTSGVVPINAPIAPIGLNPSASTEENPILTAQELVSILHNMESRGREVPHEPTEGQIGMGQAIEIARSWLLNFTDGVFSNFDAYLCQNLQDAGQFLDPIYSYWTITFRNEDMTATLTINAVTGKVLRIEIAMLSGLMEMNVDSIESSLAAFMSDIGVTGDDSITVQTDRSGIIATAGFAGGDAYAVVSAAGRPWEGGIMVGSLNMYIATSVSIMRDTIGFVIVEDDNEFTTRTQLPRN